MVRVTPTQPHIRKSSYHFYHDTWAKDPPLFVRRTAANQPPTQRPQSKEVRWLRDRFAWANQVWSTFTSDQRSFYRGIALEVTTSLGGGRVEVKLLSGQELFIAMMMKIRSYGEYQSLVPQKWDLRAQDVCGHIFENVQVTVYSKSLKRTVVRQQGDWAGLFQWISIPPWAGPFRFCYTNPDTGQICWQYDTLDALYQVTEDYLVHPVKMYTEETQRWTLAQDPTWCLKSCWQGIDAQYNFEDVHEEGPPGCWNWTDQMLRIRPLGDHLYYVQWAAWPHAYHNSVYWKDTLLWDHGNTWWVWGRYYKIIDGRTGLEV